MPVIRVIKPFGLRLGSKAERQDFGIGEHFLSDEELAHWFVQDCLQAGRATLITESVAETGKADPEGSGEGQLPVGEEPEAPAAADDAAGGDAEPGKDAGEAPAPEAGADAGAAPTREELMALTVARLKEMAAVCGLSLPSNAVKAAIVDALLARRGNGQPC